MSTAAIIFATLAGLAVWGAIVAGATRYYVNAQINAASLRAELAIRESLQANTDAINRAWGALSALERAEQDQDRRLARLEKRVNGLS